MAIARPKPPKPVQQALFDLDAPPPRVQVERQTLFLSRVIRQRIAQQELAPGLDFLRSRHAELLTWVQARKAGKLNVAETKLHGEFLLHVFGKVLGYKTRIGSAGDAWELDAEERVASNRSADGALGFFAVDAPERVLVPIELKGANQPLDHAKGRKLTPVQQAWDYAAHVPECRWILVSNYDETRLYTKARTPHEYEYFRLGELEDFDQFRRMWAMLARDALLPVAEGEPAAVDHMLEASAKEESAITAKLYQDYSRLRDDLLDHLLLTHQELPKLRLLQATQTILDRVLFILFAEWRGLVPPGLIEGVLKAEHYYVQVPIWQGFCALFDWIDEGKARAKVPAYNGGLFRRDPLLASLAVSDDLCRRFECLLNYDFADDVSVEVLGRIFEQSITHLEQKRAELTGQADAKEKSKRKLEGVYYTPRYITRYLVDQTVGAACQATKAAAEAEHLPDGDGDSAQWLAVWRSYRDRLLDLRVLDPACGSGAFLVAAYDALAIEYGRVNTELGLHGDTAGQVELDSAILNHNLFGVDLNPESVEITRLALWLKTAVKDRRLRELDRNIKHGNSIVADSTLDNYAFDWGTGNLVDASDLDTLPRTAAEMAIDARWRDGFDVVIGNPPYVRQEVLRPVKAYLLKAYGSFQGAADLYVYFYELAVRVLKPGGLTGFVASDTWLRANFAEPLRRWLLANATPTQLIGLGDNQVFADALDVNPVCSVFRKGACPVDAVVVAAMFARGVEIAEFAALLPEAGFHLPVKWLQAEWILKPVAVLALADKLAAVGKPLSQHVTAINMGLKTGLNDAFLVDTATRNHIVQGDPAAVALLGPMLRGEDLRPWYQEDEGRWLIALPCGWTAKTFGTGLDEAAAWAQLQLAHPKLAAHLAPFAEDGRERGDKGDYWWELRPCAYMADFAKPKILWPDLTQRPRWSWDERGAFVGNTGFFIAPAEPWLLAVLQSRVTWFALSGIAQPLGERGGLLRYRLFTQFTERLPIPPLTDADRATLSDLALRATKLANDRYTLDRATFARIREDLLAADDAAGRKLAEWYSLEFKTLRAEVDKRGSGMPVKERDQWQQYLGGQRAEHDRLTDELVAVETAINERVYALFGLDAGEIAVVERETRYKLGSV